VKIKVVTGTPNGVVAAEASVGKGEGYGEVMEELKRRKYLREEQFYYLLNLLLTSWFTND
jgi:hypothetical protein